MLTQDKTRLEDVAKLYEIMEEQGRQLPACLPFAAAQAGAGTDAPPPVIILSGLSNRTRPQGGGNA